MLNLLASLLYALVAAVSVLAAGAARRLGKRPATDRFWLIVAAVFAALTVSRLLGIEELLREFLRSRLELAGDYGSRRDFQAPLMILAILACAGGIAFDVWRNQKAGPGRDQLPVRWARRLVMAMIMLVVLRVVSFHALDKILFTGPHLNWILDLGLSFAVAGCALSYRRMVSQPGKGRRPQRRR